jgi:hypothetical protein
VVDALALERPYDLAAVVESHRFPVPSDDEDARDIQEREVPVSKEKRAGERKDVATGMADDLPAVVDDVEERFGRIGSVDIRGECPAVPHEPMQGALAPVRANDLTPIVIAKGKRQCALYWDVQDREITPPEHVSVEALAVLKRPDDLAAIVDSCRIGKGGTWTIDLRNR